MHGELLNVWEETFREIWIPIAEQDGVPDDVFSQLYREVFLALKEPCGDEAQEIPLGDSIQLREAFDKALALSGTNVDRARADNAFDEADAMSHPQLNRRRIAVEQSLGGLIGDGAAASRLLATTLSDLAQDSRRRAEARERTRDAIVNDTLKSRTAFERIRIINIAGERALVAFLEAAFDVFEDIGGDVLSNKYFTLLSAFIEKFSLRYDLRRPCTICPTLSGVFASLVRDLRAVTEADPHLDVLMKDFEDAVRDLRHDCSEGRIKTCIQKQVNLVEAIGRSRPGVTGITLGAICDQVGTWPHEKLKAAMKDLYSFASDYPGIRHGGTPANALRTVDMRDMVAMSIVLAGFTPYLSDALNAELVYRGA